MILFWRSGATSGRRRVKFSRSKPQWRLRILQRARREKIFKLRDSARIRHAILSSCGRDVSLGRGGRVRYPGGAYFAHRHRDKLVAKRGGNFIASSVDGLARRLEAQIVEQLGVEVSFNSTPLGGRDLLARAACFRRLVGKEGFVPVADARLAAGI